ncbi:MAG: cobalamin-dependent protein [Phycisphaerae bacterium]|nr:cobalamin-dependent protein [Phycisphaerae bacterium]
MNVSLAYLVVNSPQDTGYNYGLGYVAAALRQGGHEVDLTTLADADDVTAFRERVRSRGPGIVGLSATTSQFGYVPEIAGAIKAASGAFVVCGGPHPTLLPECLLEAPGLDGIVRGEGEEPLRELADALESGADFRTIKNGWFRDGEAIVKNPLRPFVHDLDALPFPDKDCLDYQGVIDRAGGVNRFIFSRGCTFGCTYCSNRALSRLAEGAYFRQQSVDRAIGEILHDRERYRFNRVVIDDDTITLRKDWFRDFFTRYRSEVGLPFTCNVRVGTVDRDMLGLLREAGCGTVVMGIEHGNEAFRREVLKRPMTNRQIVETFDACHALGMKTFGQAIVGFPRENKRLFLDTVRVCRRVGVRNPISIFQPYPATELGDLCRKEGWLPGRRGFRERREAVISFPGFGKEEIQLCADAFPILTQSTWIPLGLPLKWTLRIWRAVDLGRYVVRRVGQRLVEKARRVLAGGGRGVHAAFGG